MRAATTTALCFGIILSTLFLLVRACEPGQSHSGCKINAGVCVCGFGCKTDYIYRNWASCRNALLNPVRSSNACSGMPCRRGICIQTAQDPGYSCKCEGTGFYGQRCENACPTATVRGLVYPHECIVI